MNRMVRNALWATAAVAAMAIQSPIAFAGEIVWWTPNWGEARARELAAKFEAANPGITVKLEITVSDGLPTKIPTALLAHAITSGCWRLVDTETGRAVMNKRSGPVFTPDEAAKYLAVLPDRR